MVRSSMPASCFHGELSAWGICRDSRIHHLTLGADRVPVGTADLMSFPPEQGATQSRNSERIMSKALQRNTYGTAAHDAPEPRMDGSPVLRLSAGLAGMLAIVYAVPHFWWGFGVEWLAPGDMSGDTGMFRFPLVRLFAFYGMGIIAVISAVLALALRQPWGNAVPRWLLMTHASLGGAFLIFRGGIGLLESTLMATGVRECPFVGCRDWHEADQVSLTAAFWEPLFLAWGLVLLIAGIARHRRSLD